MSKTPFSVGEKWLCDKPASATRRDYPFHFVIVERGRDGKHKRCRIDVVGHDRPCGNTCHHGMIGEYSHKHLKRCASRVL